MYPLNAWSQREPTAPSTVRWSDESVTFMTVSVLKPLGSSGAGTSLSSVLPTARIHDCGGLMMAVKCEIPYMPKFEMVKLPPWYSSGLSLPSRAFVASDLVSAEMEPRPLWPASLMIGVIRPVGVATATEMSAFLYLLSERPFQMTHCRMLSPSHAELASGTSLRARAAALTTAGQLCYTSTH